MAAEGITDYYGLSVKTTKRLSRGLLFMSSFTLQKTVGVMSYQAKDDHKLSRGVSLFQEANQPRTAPYREFRLSWVYDLPFGPGKARLASGAASKILGGWSVGGILSLYGGNPFGLSSPTGSLNCFCGADGRLDQIGDLTVSQPTISRWFNTGAVRPAAFGKLGTLGITPPNLIGPDLKNVDASVSKAVKVKERYTIKGSVEVFNISNTPKFGQPGTVFGSSSFGSIGGYRGVGTGSNVSPPWFGARIMQVGARFEF